MARLQSTSGFRPAPARAAALLFALIAALCLLFAAEAGSAAAKSASRKAAAGNCAKQAARSGRARCQPRGSRSHHSAGNSSRGGSATSSDIGVAAGKSTTSADVPAGESPISADPAASGKDPVPTQPAPTPGEPDTAPSDPAPVPGAEGVSDAVTVGPAGCAASVAQGLGSFASHSQPSSCWRPYSNSSPFNTPISATAATAASSSEQISRLLSGGNVSYFVAGDSDKDYGTAVYYPTSSDPTYTVHCVEPWGRCALEGQQIQLPAGAKPSGTWPIGSGDIDSHMTVVDQTSGWEYDLWNVRTIENGQITTKWGGKTRIDGDGLDSDAVAARFGSLAGIIRASELKAGAVDHALALTIPCTVGYVAPASKGGLECADAGMSTANALPMGAHLQLQMSNAQIEALSAPVWKKAVLKAFATYGAYVEDTTGDSSQWGLKWESPASETSVGGSDRFVELAKSLGMQSEDYNGNGQGEYWFNVAGGVDWSQLRVVS